MDLKEKAANDKKLLESEVQRTRQELQESQIQLAVQQEQNNVLIQQKKSIVKNIFEKLILFLGTKSVRVHGSSGASEEQN